MVICDWFLVLSIILSEFTLLVACISASSFIMPNNIPSYRYTIIYISVHQLMHLDPCISWWHLGCFHFGATLNNAAASTLYTGFFVNIFICLECVLINDIAELYDNSTFNHLRNCCTVFQKSCTIVYSHQLFMRVLVSSHPYQYLLFSIFWAGVAGGWISSYPSKCKCYLILFFWFVFSL